MGQKDVLADDVGRNGELVFKRNFRPFGRPANGEAGYGANPLGG
jgi:hypothetical protein